MGVQLVKASGCLVGVKVVSGRRCRDGIGFIPCSRAYMCSGLSSLGGLTIVGREFGSPTMHGVVARGMPRSGVGRVGRHVRSVAFSASSIDYGVSPLNSISLHVVRHRRPGYVGFRAMGSPVRLGL